MNYRSKEQEQAYKEVARAKLTGELLPASKYFCEDCHKRRAREWHHNDYDKPLEVIALCVFCHKRRHRVEKDRERARKLNVESYEYHLKDERWRSNFRSRLQRLHKHHGPKVDGHDTFVLMCLDNICTRLGITSIV